MSERRALLRVRFSFQKPPTNTADVFKLVTSLTSFRVFRQVFFVESLCDDPDVIAENIMVNVKFVILR